MSVFGHLIARRSQEEARLSFSGMLRSPNATNFFLFSGASFRLLKYSWVICGQKIRDWLIVLQRFLADVATNEVRDV